MNFARLSLFCPLQHNRYYVVNTFAFFQSEQSFLTLHNNIFCRFRQFKNRICTAPKSRFPFLKAKGRAKLFLPCRKQVSTALKVRRTAFLMKRSKTLYHIIPTISLPARSGFFICLIESDACVPCGDGAPTRWKRYRYAWCRCWRVRECPQAWQYLFRSRRTRGQRDAAGYAERPSTG